MNVSANERTRTFLSMLLNCVQSDRIRHTRKRVNRIHRTAVQSLEDRTLLAAFNVTTTTDVINAGDGVLSLREAVIAANNLAGADEINLPAGNYERTIFNTAGPENAAAQGDFDILGNVTINGAGQGTNPATAAIINGGPATLDRVFHAAAGISVTFNNLTILGGQAFDNGTSGTASHGGGILADIGTTLVLDNVLIQNNSAHGVHGGNQTGNVGTPARGGGIYATGSSTIVIRNNTLFRSNQANGGSGGSGAPGQSGATAGNGGSGGAAQGGGLFTNGGSLSIANSNIGECLVFGGDGNSGSSDNPVDNPNKTGGNGGAAFGGGVYAVNTSVSLMDSTIYFNWATAGDGGNSAVLAGAEFNAIGGIGGSASGGGIYATGGAFALAYTAGFTTDGNVKKVASNRVSAGSGGYGTPGDAGVGPRIGGVGGIARGGGLFIDVPVGAAAPSVSDLSSNSNPTLFANVAFGGVGGPGGAGTIGFTTGANGAKGGNANGAGIYLANGQTTALTLTGVEIHLSVSGGGNGGPGGLGATATSGGTGGLGGNGAVGGDSFGAGLFVSSGITVNGTSVQFNGNQASAGEGGWGGAGRAGQYYAGLSASHGGPGGVGAVGGAARGGGVYATNATLILSNIEFLNPNRAEGGNGGRGGAGGAGGNADAGQTPGTGGSGSQAGKGGIGAGGAIYATGGSTIQLTNTMFEDGRANGGLGGPGGDGGNGGTAGSGGTAVVALNGNGGNGGNGEMAVGGAIFSSAGTVTIASAEFHRNSAVGGQVGINGTGLLNGAQGIVSGNAAGGCIYSTGAGTLTISNSTMTLNTANGAHGRSGLVGSDDPAIGQDGSDGIDGGSGGGGAVFVDGGVTSITGSTLHQNTAAGGNGGHGGIGGDSYVTAGAGGAGGGGGDAGGGGIHTTLDATSVSITNSTLSENSAVGGNSGTGGRGGDGGDPATMTGGTGGIGGKTGSGGYAAGGAIYHTAGTLTILTSSLRDGMALGGNGGNGGRGGDSFDVAGNGGKGGLAGGADGGGLAAYDPAGAIQITSSTISRNNAIAGIAGIGGDGGDAGNPVAMTGGTGGNGGVGGDGFEGAGGGIIVDSASVAVAIVNSTISDHDANSSDGGSGGNGGAAFLTDGLGGNGGNGSDVGGGGLDLKGTTLQVVQCTVTENGDTPGIGGAPGVDGDGSTITAISGTNGTTSAAGIAAFSTIVLQNSIVAGNVGDHDVSNSFHASSNFNLVGSGDGSTLVNTATNRIGSTSGSGVLLSGLGVLRNNGGTTQTHAPLPGSLAIGNGSNALIPGGVTLDQRTASRIVGGTVDIGAVESLGLDFGDAPDTGVGTATGNYQTLLSDNGPRHALVPGLFLGAAEDAETNGQPNTGATGDDTTGAPDDEDGVALTSSLVQGQTLTLNVTASTPGFLNAWIDANRDGDFADSGERFLTNVAVVAGVNPLNYPVPVGVFAGDTMMRYRLSSESQASPSPTDFLPDGEVEDYKVTVIPTRPVISSPPAVTGELRPQIAWAALAGVTQYDVWISNLSTNINPFHTAVVNGTTYVPTVDLGIGRYRLWVRAKAGAVNGAWTLPFDFTVNAKPAFAPTDLRLWTARPTLTWNALPGAHHYDIWINNVGSGAAQYIRNMNVAGTSFMPTADLPIGFFRAWVRGIAADGTPGNWSLAKDFYAVPFPNVTQGMNPTFDRTPTFAWDPLTGAVNYEVFIRNQNTGATTLNQTGILTTSFTTPTLADGPYRWWVLANGANGIRGTWTFGMDIYIGGRTSFLSPPASTSDTTPTFSWRIVDGAARYDLQVNRIDVLQPQIIRQQNLLTTSYTPTVPLAAGTYRAWIRAVGSTMESSPWSLQLDFTIVDANRPMNGAPDNNGPLHPLLDQFAQFRSLITETANVVEPVDPSYSAQRHDHVPLLEWPRVLPAAESATRERCANGLPGKSSRTNAVAVLSVADLDEIWNWGDVIWEPETT